MKRIVFLTSVITIIFCSCQPTDITTVIDGDGSCTRVFSRNADSAFIAGDTSHNPFPVKLTKDWKVQWKLSSQQQFNNWPGNNFGQQINDSTSIMAIASYHYNTVQEMADSFRFIENHEWHNFKITPRLEKKFRWFYTYYKYEETYPKLPLQLKVPLDKYMTEEESSYWLTGSPNLCEGMNGYEANSYNNDLERKFGHWMLQNAWEAQYDMLLKNLQHFAGHPQYNKMLDEKDSIFENSILKNLNLKLENGNPDYSLGNTLNKHFRTSVFSKLDDSNSTDSIINIIKNPPLLEAFSSYSSISFNYKLLMPGNILNANGVNKNDTLTWRIDAYRILKGDFTIEATSRKLNAFVTIISLLAAAGGIVFFIVKRK